MEEAGRLSGQYRRRYSSPYRVTATDKPPRPVSRGLIAHRRRSTGPGEERSPGGERQARGFKPGNRPRLTGCRCVNIDTFLTKPRDREGINGHSTIPDLARILRAPALRRKLAESSTCECDPSCGGIRIFRWDRLEFSDSRRGRQLLETFRHEFSKTLHGFLEGKIPGIFISSWWKFRFYVGN